MKRLAVVLVALVFALALPVSTVVAGSLTLHPSGFGEHSRANWQAKQGKLDVNEPSGATPTSNQALYFQKMTTTATFAAGVAIVRGLAGMPASELTGLSWEHRTDGHCL
jgi:hypothetical protein